MSLNTCITSARPTTQAIGNPFPIALPKQARSGTTPNRFCAPPRPKWKPLQISSKISNAPCWCARSFTPARKPGAGVKDLAHQHGALLIFDEICSGFHFGLGGAQKRFGVVPDLACFGKAMGNGFPIACVVGRAEVMQVFNDIFYSFTFAGELSSIAAAMKVLDILERTDALARLHASGRRLQDGLNAMAKEAGLGEQLKATADPRWSLLKFRDREGNDSALVKNLFQQEAVKRGILLLATHNLSAAHDGPAIQQTLEAYAEVIKTLAEWLRDPHPERFLEGPMSQPVFKVR